MGTLIGYRSRKVGPAPWGYAAYRRRAVRSGVPHTGHSGPLASSNHWRQPGHRMPHRQISSMPPCLKGTVSTPTYAATFWIE